MSNLRLCRFCTCPGMAALSWLADGQNGPPTSCVWRGQWSEEVEATDQAHRHSSPSADILSTAFLSEAHSTKLRRYRVFSRIVRALSVHQNDRQVGSILSRRKSYRDGPAQTRRQTKRPFAAPACNSPSPLSSSNLIFGHLLQNIRLHC